MIKITRIWLYQLVTLILTRSVSPCSSHSDYCDSYMVNEDHCVYHCRTPLHSPEEIEINVISDIIQIRCAEYLQPDYFKLLKNIEMTELVEKFEIINCPVPNARFVKFITVFSFDDCLVDFAFTNAKFPVSSKGVPTLKPYHFKKLTSFLATLNLTNNSFEELPEKLFGSMCMVELKKLFLNGNRLKKLPTRIFQYLWHLKVLNLSENRLSSLDEKIFNNVTSLIELNLNKNNLDNLPSSIFNTLTNLQELQLRDNNMKILNDGIFNNLKSLRILNISGNKFIRVPKMPLINNLNLTALFMTAAFDKGSLILPSEFHNNLSSLKILQV